MVTRKYKTKGFCHIMPPKTRQLLSDIVLSLSNNIDESFLVYSHLVSSQGQATEVGSYLHSVVLSFGCSVLCAFTAPSSFLYLFIVAKFLPDDGSRFDLI